MILVTYDTGDLTCNIYIYTHNYMGQCVMRLNYNFTIDILYIHCIDL